MSIFLSFFCDGVVLFADVLRRGRQGPSYIIKAGEIYTPGPRPDLPEPNLSRSLNVRVGGAFSFDVGVAVGL